MEPHRGTATVVIGPGGRVFVPIGGDPDALWGRKPTHHVTGTVNGMPVRAVVEQLGDGHGIVLGPAWRRDCGISAGDIVTMVLVPEGPQRGDLAEDVAAAFAANPAAGEFFDSLAQFYQRGYLRWIDATRRKPALRAERIAEVVALLAAGVKQRPTR